jgi:hypothetical protein
MAFKAPIEGPDPAEMRREKAYKAGFKAEVTHWNGIIWIGYIGEGDGSGFFFFPTVGAGTNRERFCDWSNVKRVERIM